MNACMQIGFVLNLVIVPLGAALVLLSGARTRGRRLLGALVGAVALAGLGFAGVLLDGAPCASAPSRDRPEAAGPSEPGAPPPLDAAPSGGGVTPVPESRTGPPADAAEPSEAAAPLPTPAAPAGLSAAGAPRAYDARSLYQAIDGAADLYVRNGLVAAVFCDYRLSTGPLLSLEIYDLGSPAGAEALFAHAVDASRARTPGLGDAAAGDDEGVDARLGRFYVRVTHAEAQPAGLAVPMLALARAALVALGPVVSAAPAAPAAPTAPAAARPAAVPPEDAR